MCHVLIIEDEPFIAMNIQAMLEDEGATSFYISVSEEEAVAAAFDRTPELITSDVRLAAGTGPRAVARIQERLGEIPVIFISGTPSECHHCEPLGIVLAKPITESALREAFHRMV